MHLGNHGTIKRKAWSIPSYRIFLFCIADEKKQNLASYRKTVRAFVI